VLRVFDDLKQRGVMVSPCAAWELRFVTHRHIGDTEVDQAISAFAGVWNDQARR
jgi:threonine aldolase